MFDHVEKPSPRQAGGDDQQDEAVELLPRHAPLSGEAGENGVAAQDAERHAQSVGVQGEANFI